MRALAGFLLAIAVVSAQPASPQPATTAPPIIDMHMHALAADAQGPPPLGMCIAPDDPRMEPYWALAEELDIPVGIHIGTGPPGVVYLGAAKYRARLHSALTVEEVVAKHPKLRLYIMHAGYPMIDDLLAVLYAHPQVYVDVGIIVYNQPRPAFYRYLQAIIDAGFGSRVMFGSDQMVWPGTIERAITVIEEAPFLSAAQKRDIFYNNAARFLRLQK